MEEWCRARVGSGGRRPARWEDAGGLLAEHFREVIVVARIAGAGSWPEGAVEMDWEDVGDPTERGWILAGRGRC